MVPTVQEEELWWLSGNDTKKGFTDLLNVKVLSQRCIQVKEYTPNDTKPLVIYLVIRHRS